jgi:hypothetical protein
MVASLTLTFMCYWIPNIPDDDYLSNSRNASYDTLNLSIVNSISPSRYNEDPLKYFLCMRSIFLDCVQFCKFFVKSTISILTLSERCKIAHMSLFSYIFDFLNILREEIQGEIVFFIAWSYITRTTKRATLFYLKLSIES